MIRIGNTEIDDSTFPRALIETDGKTTCLMHRQHEWTLANYVPHMPRCTICGGVVDPRLETHALCRARVNTGQSITPLDSTPVCSCAVCAELRRNETHRGKRS